MITIFTDNCNPISQILAVSDAEIRNRLAVGSGQDDLNRFNP
jgi:hypothetical protein